MAPLRTSSWLRSPLSSAALMALPSSAGIAIMESVAADIVTMAPARYHFWRQPYPARRSRIFIGVPLKLLSAVVGQLALRLGRHRVRAQRHCHQVGSGPCSTVAARLCRAMASARTSIAGTTNWSSPSVRRPASSSRRMWRIRQKASTASRPRELSRHSTTRRSGGVLEALHQPLLNQPVRSYWSPQACHG